MTDARLLVSPGRPSSGGEGSPSNGRAAGGDAAEDGATLLELVVALAILSLALLLAGALLREGQTMAYQVRQAQTAGSLPLAEAWLRLDVQGASGRAIQPGEWGTGASWTVAPLVLERPDGGAVEWRLDGDVLVRRSLDGTGATVGERPMLSGVRSLRWHGAGAEACGGTVSSRLVGIELVVVGSEGRRWIARPGPRGTPGLAGARVRTLCLALRGGGLGVGW